MLHQIPQPHPPVHATVHPWLVQTILGGLVLVLWVSLLGE